MTDEELLSEAAKARENAYAPYSMFKVGAALLCEDGSVYRGCNIENAAFSPSICAERVAVSKAVSEGKRKFVKIAVVGGKENAFGADCFPCGVCRQVLNEFSPDIFVVVGSPEKPKRYRLNELLPFSFGASALD